MSHHLLLRIFVPAGIGALALAHAGARADDDTRHQKAVEQIVVQASKRATVAASATKTATPIAETPQSITAIDAAKLADLDVQNLNQALRYVAGITPETRGSAAEVYDQFNLRGFNVPIYLDGLRLFASATGYAEPQVDISRLDRVEVLKGPASALYGQSSPGGLVDEASWMPLDNAFYGGVNTTYGSYDLYRVDGDVGGRLAPDILWRVYGSVNGAHDEQDFGIRERQTISGAITFGADKPTSLTLLANYSHDPYNGDYGVFPALGTLLPDPAGRIPTHFYGGEPDDFFRREQASLTYIFRHAFSDDWAVRASGRYQFVNSQLGIVYTSGTPVDLTAAAPTLFSRASYATREQLDDWTFDNQLTGHVHTGPLDHRLLFGVDQQSANSDELYAFGAATPIDVFNPVYGTMKTPASPYQVPGYGPGFAAPTDVSTRQLQTGIYAQDQIAVGGLRVTLSGREDWAREVSGAQSDYNTRFTWRAGALYVTPIHLSPYVSYATSFEPQAAQLKNGSLASPSLGKQFEAGAKYQVPGTDFLLTGAWFDITQTNVVVYDPVSFLATQAGKVRSEGVEVEASGSLPYDFNVRFAFSRQVVRDVEDINTAAVGLSLATVGRGGVTADLEWVPKSGPLQGLAIGGTIRHLDGVYADRYFNDQVYNTPDYTLFDARVRYDLGAVRPTLHGVTLAVTATNLTDKDYLSSCYANYGWCWYGNRRTVLGSIGYQW